MSVARDRKSLRYGIGIILGALLLGLLAAPLLGEGSGYKILGMIHIMQLLNQFEPLVLIVCIFLLFFIVAVSICTLSGIIGFTFSITKHSNSKAENTIAWIYNAALLAVIISFFISFCLILGWSTKSSTAPGYGLFVLLGLTYFVPYFANTKMHMAFVVCMIITMPAIGVIFYIVENELNKKKTAKQTTQDQDTQQNPTQ